MCKLKYHIQFEFLPGLAQQFSISVQTRSSIIWSHSAIVISYRYPKLSLFTIHVFLFTVVLCLWSLLQINATFNLSGFLFVVQSTHCVKVLMGSYWSRVADLIASLDQRAVNRRHSPERVIANLITNDGAQLTAISSVTVSRKQLGSNSMKTFGSIKLQSCSSPAVKFL